MLNLTNKGFVLVETLITAVFVMAIFSVVYVNFYPIMAEYEKREKELTDYAKANFNIYPSTVCIYLTPLELVENIVEI